VRFGLCYKVAIPVLAVAAAIGPVRIAGVPVPAVVPMTVITVVTPVSIPAVIPVRRMPIIAVPEIYRRRGRANYRRSIHRGGGVNRGRSSVNWRLVHRRTHSYGRNREGYREAEAEPKVDSTRL
jgi:hypothetical protein